MSKKMGKKKLMKDADEIIDSNNVAPIENVQNLENVENVEDIFFAPSNEPKTNPSEDIEFCNFDLRSEFNHLNWFDYIYTYILIKYNVAIF